MVGRGAEARWYLLAVVLVVLATAVRLAAVDPVLEGRVPLPAYFAAVIVSVWLGGVGPGLLAAGLGYAAVIALTPARGQGTSPASYLVTGLSYWLVCGSTIALAERLRRARASAESHAAEAERGRAALAEGDRRKDEFLAMLAHELRNPLAPIRSTLDLLRLKSAQPGAVARMREVMERQVGHLCRLVDDLMDVSRISRGRIDLRKQWVELASVVGDAVETSRSLMDEAGVRFTLELPAQPVWLYVDPTRLAQVVANLLNNAARFTPPGGHVALVAKVEGPPPQGSTVPSGQQLALVVRDDGVGISREALSRIFDLYVQGRDELQRSSGGLGIGLSLARRLAQLHGGSLEASSEGVSRGSEFVLRVPLALGAEDAAPPGQATAPRDPELASRARRLLVVDDNRDAAASLAELLELLGHEVRVVHDGPSALAALASFAADTVFLDIGLPGMSGYEVARRLRGTADRAGPMLIAVTGWGQEEDRRRSREAGFDAHLLKPLDLGMVERILAGGDPAGGPVEGTPQVAGTMTGGAASARAWARTSR
jgi:signal transduction histidine kinase/ActR/RegA family two-component response regulator